MLSACSFLYFVCIVNRIFTERLPGTLNSSNTALASVSGGYLRMICFGGKDKSLSSFTQQVYCTIAFVTRQRLLRNSLLSDMKIQSLSEMNFILLIYKKKDHHKILSTIMKNVHDFSLTSKETLFIYLHIFKNQFGLKKKTFIKTVSCNLIS